MKGLTTNQGFNAVGLLAIIFEFGGKYVPPEHGEAFTYFCTVALILICWFTRGSHPSDGIPAESDSTDDEPVIEETPEQRKRMIRDVLRRTR